MVVPALRGFPRPRSRSTAGLVALSAALLAAITAISSPAAAQETADRILATVAERQQERLADVQNYTLVREVEGRRSVIYYERQEEDGVVRFEPLGPLKIGLVSGAFDDTPLARLAPGGDVLAGLKGQLVGAATQAGATAVAEQLQAAAPAQVASLVDALIRPPPPGEDVSLGSLVDVDAFKDALIEGAVDAGLRELARHVLGMGAGPAVALLDVVRGRASPGELLGELGQMVLHGATGGLSGQMAGGAAGPAGAMSAGAMGPGGMGPAAAGGVAGGLAQAGMGLMTAAVGQMMAGKAMEAADEVMTPRLMGEIDAFGAISSLEGRAVLEGAEDLDGRPAWKLRATDLEGMEGADELRDGELLLWIDRERYVPLRMAMSGEVDVEGEWTPVRMTARLEDYREAGPMLLPGRTVTLIEGMDAGVQVSDEEREEMREQMARMEEELEKMPPEQRAMVEQMMKSRMPQMAQMERMMEGGPMEFRLDLIEARVDEGPPPELVEEARAMARAAESMERR